MAHCKIDSLAWFMGRIEPELNTGCWLWSGAVDSGGYGLSGATGIKRAPHLSLKLFKGLDRPAGMVSMHSCDTPSCVNPRHLSWGTQSQNIKDAYTRGRANGVPPKCHGQRHGNSKVSDADRREMYRMRVSGSVYREIADKYGLTIPAVFYICKNDRWKK